MTSQLEMREGILMCLAAQTGIFIWKYFCVVRTKARSREWGEERHRSWVSFTIQLTNTKPQKLLKIKLIFRRFLRKNSSLCKSFLTSPCPINRRSDKNLSASLSKLDTFSIPPDIHLMRVFLQQSVSFKLNFNPIPI